MRFLAVLGRQAELARAELNAQFNAVKPVGNHLALFDADTIPNLNRLGGTVKLARPLPEPPIDFLRNLPDHRLVIGLSDYSPSASAKSIQKQGLTWKKILSQNAKSVRVIPNRAATLSSATVFHNQLGEKAGRWEFLKIEKKWYLGLAVQNIRAYAQRDQQRPARNAKIGMLPPKLAQIMLNLAGNLPLGTRILDPFCGTGVILQEALLLGYRAYGTDLSPRMINYSRQNLAWLLNNAANFLKSTPVSVVNFTTLTDSAYQLAVGDAAAFQWTPPLDAVVSETYLGPPLSKIPSPTRLQELKTASFDLILRFLSNLSPQLAADTPVVLATPAWLDSDNRYQSLNLLDEISRLGYNKTNLGPLRYSRPGQIVAREILVLRKS